MDDKTVQVSNTRKVSHGRRKPDAIREIDQLPGLLSTLAPKDRLRLLKQFLPVFRRIRKR
jgi:hypothetical protein